MKRKPITTISLQKFDDNFEDYYDSLNKYFVLYSGYQDKDGSPAKIETDVKIKDYDSVIWDCYLWKVEYIPRLDMYEIKYKPYEE